ncbi:MAG: ParB/RepB/Spo0J family partition protein [Gaiellaceae bacterium]
MSSVAQLVGLDPDLIKANPDNPRLVFREGEMSQLLESIRTVGIQVPLSVYQDGKSWILIDGERRWRCARRLNLDSVPVLVQPKPGRLENILMMFNIHNVRTDWDLISIAKKLGEVRDMLVSEGKRARPRDLSGLTGVTLPTVNRALELLELPDRYQQMLLNEAEKPREEQTITPDVFIEINKSRRVIASYAPEVFDEVSHGEYLDSMIDKYQSGVVKNLVNYRDVSKIARAERAGGEKSEVVPVLVRLVRDPKLGVAEAYEETVRAAYDARDLTSRADALFQRLHGLEHGSGLTVELRALLLNLRKEIDRLLGAQ